MRVIPLAGLAFALSLHAAGAAPILQQDPLINGGGLTSSTSFQGYDDFSLSSNASVVALSWWAQDTAPTTRTFQIRFTTTINGQYPNALSPFYSATVTASSVVVGSFTYRFDANLPTPAVLAGNTNLFISIEADNFVWGRASDAPSPGALGGNLADSYNTATSSNILQGVDVAWALQGTPFATAVPEPASIALLGFGVLGAIARRARRAA